MCHLIKITRGFSSFTNYIGTVAKITLATLFFASFSISSLASTYAGSNNRADREKLSKLGGLPTGCP